MGKGSDDDNTGKNISPSPPPPVWLRSGDEETVTPVTGKLSGHLPSWLNGRLTRNGPGKAEYGDTRYNHLFDVSSYIHQFNIKDGTVTYQSRFLQSDTFKKNSEANRIIVSEFGTVAHPDPCKSLLQRFMSMFTLPDPNDSTDNCSVSMCYFGDELYALTETSNMRKVDPETLNVVGEKTNLENYIAVHRATAHPHTDPDGTVYNMGNGFTFKMGPTYNIIKFPPAKEVNGKKLSSVEQAEVILSIPCQWRFHPSYYHSFGITDNYFIFVEQPLVFDLKKAIVNHFIGSPFIGAVKWFGDEKTKFRIVKRDTGKVLETSYEADAFMTLHHTNAYEKDGQLVVDLTCMDNGNIVYDLMLKNLEDPAFECSPELMPEHRRFVLPLNIEGADVNTNLVTLKGTKCTAYKRREKTVDVSSELIASNQYFEMPRINYKHNGKEYTYAYGIEVDPKGIQFTKLVKMNVKTGETNTFYEEGKLVSEPVFVSAPNAVEEDQGVILSTLIDKENPRFVALLVLDPRTWKEMGRVEFEARGTVTSTFHGQFAAPNESVHLF